MDIRLLLSDAIELHQLDCRSQRFTERTLETYSYRLGVFLRFIGDMPLVKVQSAHLRSFQNELIRREYTSETQHGLMRAIRAFLNFCVRDELIDRSPMKSIKMPRLEKKLPVSLSESELESVLKICRLRDKALVMLIATSGVRSAELCKLNVEDVNLKTGVVMVKQGKGQKDRITYIDTTTCKLVKRYLLTRKGVKPSHPLFTSHNVRNARLTPNTTNLLFQRLQETSGVHVTAHGLRRTFATRAMRSGMNIYVTAKLMGHTDIDVLKQYLDVQDEDAQDAYQRIFG